MSQNVFMVDLHHAGGEDEEVNRLIDEIPTDTKRIFLLGDIFHYWVNDESFIQERYTPFLSRLKRLAGQGIELFFIEGNRDFLVVPYLEEEPWIDVLLNPTLLDLHGRAIYIGHGDELCWNDWQYQLYKALIRSSPVKYLADHLPSAMKQSVVKNMERASKSFIAGKKKESLQVPERAYKAVIDTGIDAIVHGHLHETYQRQITSNGRVCQVFCFGWKNGKRNIIHFDG